MRGLIRKGWNTDVNYDPPRGFYNGMDGRLQNRFSWGKQVRVARGMAYIKPSGKGDNPCDLFKPLLFVLFRVAHRSGVNHAAKVLVHRFRENVHIPLQESLIPFVYEFDLRGV